MSELLLSVKNISKTIGSKQLFKDLSFGVFQGEKIGLTGPNGVGKSTLLKILAQMEEPSRGELSQKKQLNMAFVSQTHQFQEEKSINEYLVGELTQIYNLEHHQAEIQAAMSLSIVGFSNFNEQISILSGGWRKRLAIALAISLEPELLILDEPTNHMDWDGIFWLESWLKSYKNSLILVSHDRQFLNNNVNRVIELNSLYKEGYLSFNCSYDEFLERKREFIKAQLKEQESLANKASRELSWLRAGVKARTTKSKSRIDNAYALMDEFNDLKSRNLSVTQRSRLEIDATERKTKRLIEIKNLEISFSEKKLIKNLNLKLGPKTCLGLLGANGSGKTSLLKVINRELSPQEGEIFYADQLQVVYFDQKRESINQDVNLLHYLGDGSDFVIFKEKSIHVASYASRFLFPNEKFHLKISQLSGGEQARLLIAKVLLKPADLLILDEPTNDLDIETIELLEEVLSDFSGLVILVSHDRSFLKNLCDYFLALDGSGSQELFSSLDQWLKSHFKKNKTDKVKMTKVGLNVSQNEKDHSVQKKKLKLSYNDKRFLENVESEISMLENEVKVLENKLQDPNIMADQVSLNEVIKDMTEKKSQVDSLYSKWDEIESKSSEYK